MTAQVLANTRLPTYYLKAPNKTTWVRNPSWLTFTPPTISDQKVIGVYAIFPDSNFIALTCAGNYTVDWGDGTSSQNYSSGTVAYYQYDYTSSALNNTNAPVTLTDSGDVVGRTAHGYTNGMTVKFWNIVSTTGLTEAQIYYVINAAANTFQVSTTPGGSAVALTTDGSATLLPYKQVIVTITPNGGNLTTVNIQKRHNQSGLNYYNSGWLDLAIAGQFITLMYIGSSDNSGSQSIFVNNLEQVNIIKSAVTSCNFMFYACYGLQNIVQINTGTCTSFSYMFSSCNSLTTIPLLNTSAGTNFSYMFNACNSLTTIPLLNTSSGTNFSNMFCSCNALTTIPLLNTSSGTDFSGMFSSCYSLTTIPLLNTSSGTNFSFMLSSCFSLTTIPLLNTSAGTSFNSMFSSCYSLTTIPLLNTSSGINFSGMFNACYSLTTIPLLNTSNGTNFSSMFSTCNSLTTIPLLDTHKSTNFNRMFYVCARLLSIPQISTAGSGIDFNSMFNGCSNLLTIPAFTLASSIDVGSMFAGCSQLSSSNVIGSNRTMSYASCKLSKTALENIFNNLGKASSLTLTITGNWGTDTPVSISGTATSSNRTITGFSNTAGVAVGMQITGTGTALTTGDSITFTASTGRVNYGWSNYLNNGDQVSFKTITTTTGITTYTLYYVINKTASDFQLSLTNGGTAITLTNDGSGTMLVLQVVTAYDANTVTLNVGIPTGGTNTYSFRALKTGIAIMKGWTVTG